MAQQETVFIKEQADEILSHIPTNAQEAYEIAQAIANGWELRVTIASSDEQEAA